jgi:hypothetical protein
MTRARLIVIVCAGAIGFVAGKLLPWPVMAAAALLSMIWAWSSLRQIERSKKMVEQILLQVNRKPQ